jgi:folate-binding protein YgfZ
MIRLDRYKIEGRPVWFVLAFYTITAAKSAADCSSRETLNSAVCGIACRLQTTHHSPNLPFMSTTSLSDFIRSEHSAQVDGDTILNFGDVRGERQAAAESAAVVPLPALIRIAVTGKDRARFLHNFCTNNINDLPPQHICEAFFTDVKAKIIGHGYVAATEDRLEIWMLPGDQDVLLKHLDRYIITDDVQLQALSPIESIAVTGPKSASVLQAANLPEAQENQIAEHDDGTAAVTLQWDECPLHLLHTTDPVAAWQSLVKSGARPAGSEVFEDLRIREAFPRIGVDLTADHMAPEANRNRSAISYTKGCYLGQEPIARLDALGHVNRQLFKVSIVESESADDDQDPAKLPLITSLSGNTEDRRGLSVLQIKSIDANGQAVARLSDGSVVRVQT